MRRTCCCELPLVVVLGASSAAAARGRTLSPRSRDLGDKHNWLLLSRCAAAILCCIACCILKGESPQG